MVDIVELDFESREAFRAWLVENHQQSKGIWLVFGKAGMLKSIQPDEALEEALCFGWIDGQIARVDDNRYKKKFTPRRKGSAWSARNRALAAGLMENGKMTDAGRAAVEQAKKDGTWELPQPEPISEEQIAILVAALSGADLALENFLKMPLSARKTYTALYLDAKKEETRIKRLGHIIERLENNLKPMEVKPGR